MRVTVSSVLASLCIVGSVGPLVAAPSTARADDLILPELLSVEMGVGFRGFGFEGGAFDGSLTQTGIFFGMLFQSEGVLMGLDFDLSSFLSDFGITGVEGTEMVYARIFRFRGAGPFMSLGEGFAFGAGMDFDWMGFWAPGDAQSGTRPSQGGLGNAMVMTGLSADVFMRLPGMADHMAHAWVTIGANMDFDNLGEGSGSFIVGPTIRLEAEYVWQPLGWLDLHAVASWSYYGMEDSKAFERIFKLMLGFDIFASDDPASPTNAEN